MIIIFRINDIIDLPVVDIKSMKRICSIRDVIIDLRESKVYALVCREKLFGGLFEAVPFVKVISLSQNNVIVEGRNRIISIRESMLKKRRHQSYQSILGKLVQSSKGETPGVVRDILIDADSGVIRAYELSEGYLDDFVKGRQIVELGLGNKQKGINFVIEENNERWHEL